MSNKLWKAKALQFVKDFPRKTFMAEEVREMAYEKGLPKPENCRIWGGVIKQAVKEGIIRRIGFDLVRNPNAHKTPASCWEKV